MLPPAAATTSSRSSSRPPSEAAEAATSKASVHPGLGNDRGPGSAGPNRPLVLAQGACAVEPVPGPPAVEGVEELPQRHHLAVAPHGGAAEPRLVERPQAGAVEQSRRRPRRYADPGRLGERPPALGDRGRQRLRV